MADIRVYRLPKTTDPVLLAVQSEPLRFARLKSLQVDPQAFKSKYEDEITQPPEFWLDRLRPENAQHFVAEASPSSNFEDIEYKAIMVVLAPSAPIEEHGTATYHFAAIWVDPKVRGQKVGSRMFEESIRWIREDASKNGWKQVRYELGVKLDNHRAINLYTRLGFSPVDKEDEDGLVQMNMVIDVG